MINFYIAWGIHSDKLKVKHVRMLIKNIEEIILSLGYPCVLSTEVIMPTI